MLSQTAAHNLGRNIKVCLKANRLQCAATTALNVKGCLAAGEYIETWCHLMGWYCSAEDRAPKPSPETLAKQTDKRIQLYVRPRIRKGPFSELALPVLVWVPVLEWADFLIPVLELAPFLESPYAQLPFLEQARLISSHFWYGTGIPVLVWGSASSGTGIHWCPF
jgi:hypothetical protein